MTKVKLKDATKELAQDAAKVLGDATRVRKSADALVKSLREVRDGFVCKQEEQAARLLGKSQSAIANKLRLLKHGDQVLAALREAGLTERHARALLKLPGETEKLEAIREISRLGLSVAATEKYIETLLTEKIPRRRQTNICSFLNNLTESLARIQRSGIPAVTERRETDSQIVLTITIPKDGQMQKKP